MKGRETLNETNLKFFSSIEQSSCSSWSDNLKKSQELNSSVFIDIAELILIECKKQYGDDERKEINQSSRLVPDQYLMDEMNTSTHKEICEYNAKHDVDEKKHMLTIIYNCYFEAGVYSEADEYFEYLVNKYRSFSEPLAILSDITNHNIDQEHVLEGVLHILSSQDYNHINPIGITIVLACAVNHSPVIQDLLISCFESWDSEDGIDILQKLQLDMPWMIKYRDDVINQLKEKAS